MLPTVDVRDAIVQFVFADDDDFCNPMHPSYSFISLCRVYDHAVGHRGLGRIKVDLSKGLQGLGKIKVGLGRWFEDLGKTKDGKVRLGRGFEGLGKIKLPLGRRELDSEPGTNNIVF